jgi:small-conductance mechanosensitive channel
MVMAEAQQPTTSKVFTPLMRSWIISFVAGLLIPLFTFPALIDWTKTLIRNIPMDVETGTLYTTNEPIVLVIILLTMFVFYLIVVLYQIWLSVVKTDFKLMLPVLLTLTGPLAIVLLGEVI